MCQVWRHCSTAEFPYCIAHSLGHLLLAAGCVLLFAFGSTLRTLLSPADGPHPLQFVAINFVAMILPPSAPAPAPSSAPCHFATPAPVPVLVLAYLSNSPRFCRCHSCLRLGPACYLLPPARVTSCFRSLTSPQPGRPAWLIICHDCCAAEVSHRWCYDFDAGSRMAKSATANTKAPTYRTLPHHHHPADPQATDPANPPADAVDAVHPTSKRLPKW